MIEQLKTIRSELTSLHGIVGDLSEALAALSELESSLAQYEAGDMASAAAQGFRDGVASVTQQPQNWRPITERVWDGINWYDAEVNVPSGSKLYTAAPAAQQPQADSLESLLSTAIGLLMGYEDRDGKGGTRNPYKPGSAVANFVAECVERLKDWPMTDSTQQPQAGAVRVECHEVIAGVTGNTVRPRELTEREHNVLMRALVRSGEKVEAPQQAEAVPTIYVSRGQLENLKPDPEDEAGTYLPVRKTPKGKFTHPLFGAPQQAEAAPSDVVRDADLALDLLSKLFNAYENGLACYEDPDEQAGYVGNAVELDADTIHACADLLNRRRPIAAIAQQKGGV